MVLHIMPSFFCSLRCSYCYLGCLRNNKSLLNLDTLYRRLQEWNTINTINIYGGEVLELELSYILELLNICKQFASNISVITNLEHTNVLSALPSWITWGTSINNERDKDLLHRQFLLTIKDKPNVTTVVTPSVIETGPKVIDELLPLCSSLTFIRYSPSIYNHCFSLTDDDYEQFLIQVLNYIGKDNVPVTNIYDIEECCKGTYRNSLLEDNFIGPDGNYKVISYTTDGYEYFKTVEDKTEVYRLATYEQKQYRKNCLTCEFFGHCYAEHLYFIKRGETCCGLKKLLQHKQSIYKNY